MQNPRVRLALMAVSTLALLAIAGFVIFADPGSGETKPAITDGFAGAIRPRAPAADFTLADQDGRSVAVAALRGRPVVVTFMYTTCKNDCPTMTQQIRGALDDVGRDVPVLAVSVDPANDTPDSARRFLAKQQMTGRMRFLLGSDAQLQRVWRTFGIQPQGAGGREHSASVVLLDDSGVARVSFPVDQLTPEGLAHDLRALERTGAQS
jgi:protein SCO1